MSLIQVGVCSCCLLQPLAPVSIMQPLALNGGALFLLKSNQFTKLLKPSDPAKQTSKNFVVLHGVTLFRSLIPRDEHGLDGFDLWCVWCVCVVMCGVCVVFVVRTCLLLLVGGVRGGVWRVV